MQAMKEHCTAHEENNIHSVQGANVQQYHEATSTKTHNRNRESNLGTRATNSCTSLGCKRCHNNKK